MNFPVYTIEKAPATAGAGTYNIYINNILFLKISSLKIDFNYIKKLLNIKELYIKF